jgi:hypothetical protein
MAWVQDKKFFGIKKGLSGAGAALPSAVGAPWDRTVYVSPVIEPPGAHRRVATAPNPSAFSFGVSVKADVDPHHFLHRRSGFGGGTTMRAAAAVPRIDRAAKIGRPPATGYATARNNPPNTGFRRAYERGDLPVIVSHASGKRTLSWKTDRGAPTDVDYAHYLPLFADGLREEQEPLPWLSATAIADMARADPARIAPLIPLIVIPLRNALNTRRREVMVRVVETMRELATCDAAAPGGARVARAMVPYFRQLLPIVNIFATRFRNRPGVDDEPRNVKNLEDRIQALLVALETHGGADAFINIRYMVPTYTSCKLV